MFFLIISIACSVVQTGNLEIFIDKIGEGKEVDNVVYVTKENVVKTIEGRVMDELGLTKICCRRHMLTHVDLD